MRRLLPLIVTAALALPLGGAPASACAAPDEGEPQCCDTLITVTVAGRTIVLRDPTKVPNCP